jgi:hypothetical protein
MMHFKKLVGPVKLLCVYGVNIVLLICALCLQVAFAIRMIVLKKVISSFS